MRGMAVVEDALKYSWALPVGATPIASAPKMRVVSPPAASESPSVELLKMASVPDADRLPEELTNRTPWLNPDGVPAVSDVPSKIEVDPIRSAPEAKMSFHAAPYAPTSYVSLLDGYKCPVVVTEPKTRSVLAFEALPITTASSLTEKSWSDPLKPTRKVDVTPTIHVPPGPKMRAPFSAVVKRVFTGVVVALPISPVKYSTS